MPRILFDRKSEQAIVHCLDGKRLSDFMQAITDLRGFSVAMSDGTAPLDGQLRDADVFVITSRLDHEQSASFGHLSDVGLSTAASGYQLEEVEALSKHVAWGGGLLLLSNHGDLPGGNPYDWTKHDKIVAAAFGVTIEPAWFALPGGAPAILGEDRPLADHPIVQGAPGEQPVHRLAVGACCAVRGGPDAAPLARLSSHMIDRRDGRSVGEHCFAVAVHASGDRHGRVVVGARSGVLGSEGTSSPGKGMFQHADNRRFFVNVVRWLAQTL